MQALIWREAYDPRAYQPAKREGGRKRESGCPANGQQRAAALTNGRWMSESRDARIELTLIPSPSAAPEDGLSLRCRGARGSCRFREATLIARGCEAACHDGASPTTNGFAAPAWAARSRVTGDSIAAPRHAATASTATARAVGGRRRGEGRCGFKADSSQGGSYHHRTGNLSPHSNLTSAQRWGACKIARGRTPRRGVAGERQAGRVRYG